MNYYVYIGKDNKNNIVYVGTTIQKPEDRFRWHKANGKRLNFEVFKQCISQEEMLNTEYELIQKYHPKLNKITNRKQNFNKKLTKEELNKRKGNEHWCQKCLRRRVNKGYKYCFWCN